MKIKCLVMDVDGTLTNGKIYMTVNGEYFKCFNVKDGYAISKILSEYNIIPVIITGRKSEITSKRAEELGISHVYQEVHNKLAFLKKIAKENSWDFCEIAYIGDDLNDLDCIKECCYTACPADASPTIKSHVNYICSSNGGAGAVREFIDFLITNNKLFL